MDTNARNEEKQSQKGDDPKPTDDTDDGPVSSDREPETSADAGNDAGDEPSRADEAKPASGAPKRKKKKKKAKTSAEAPSAPEPASKPPQTVRLVIGGVLVAALVGGGVYMVRRQSAGHGKWSVGDIVDVELTLVATDGKNLACASTAEVAGRHCAFETQSKAWSKTADADDKKMLKPYTTTDKVQLTAAGVWSEPALADGKLPTTRFSVKCKYKVEGNLVKPSIRWAAAGPWSESPRDWYAGVVSGCTLVN